MESTNKDNFNATGAAAYLLFSRNTLYHHVRKGHILQQPDGTFSKVDLDRYKTKFGYATADNTAIDDEYTWKAKYLMLLKIAREEHRAFWTIFQQMYGDDLKEIDEP